MVLKGKIIEKNKNKSQSIGMFNTHLCRLFDEMFLIFIIKKIMRCCNRNDSTQWTLMASFGPQFKKGSWLTDSMDTYFFLAYFWVYCYNCFQFSIMSTGCLIAFPHL